VARVPTGMKTGVSTLSCEVTSVATRAREPVALAWTSSFIVATCYRIAMARALR
jgi:hypothetical protein